MSPVPAEYVVSSQSLALGVELVDMQRGGWIVAPLQVAFDGVPRPLPRSRWPRREGLFEVPDVLERLERHGNGRFALLDRPALPDPLALRILDRSRRYVPRRLSVSLAARPATIQPGLYPGAAYDVTDRVTGIRGTVVRGPAGSRRPARWCRVIARAADGGVVGRAHGDDRGEFLLLLSSAASDIGDLIDPLAVSVTVFGRLVEPPPPTPALPTLDPLWDLPLETVAAGPPDDVARGWALPPGYVETATSARTVDFSLGVLKSEPDFVFTST